MADDREVCFVTGQFCEYFRPYGAGREFCDLSKHRKNFKGCPIEWTLKATGDGDWYWVKTVRK